MQHYQGLHLEQPSSAAAGQAACGAACPARRHCPTRYSEHGPLPSAMLVVQSLLRHPLCFPGKRVQSVQQARTFLLRSETEIAACLYELRVASRQASTHTWHASSVSLHGKVRGYAVCWDRPSVKRALLLKQQTRPHGTVWCAPNFPVKGNERPAVPAKACLGINGQGRGAGEGQTLCGPVSVSLGDSSRTNLITNYQMAPSERGAGGGSATHKEPT